MNIQQLCLPSANLILFHPFQRARRQIGKATLMTVMIGSFVPLMSLASTTWASTDEQPNFADLNPLSQDQPELDITQGLLLNEGPNKASTNPSAVPCEVLELDITQSLLLSGYSHD